MSLTAQQLTTLKADILAKAQPGGPFEPYLPTQQYGDVQNFYNALTNPAVSIWDPLASVTAIFNAVDRSKYTPADAADGTALFTNRILAAQTKLMSLDGMLIGRSTLDATLASIRTSLRDAVIALPTGAGGASTNPGGTNGSTVMNAIKRTGTVVEVLLSSGDATTGGVTCKVPTFWGELQVQDIVDALAQP